MRSFSVKFGRSFFSVYRPSADMKKEAHRTGGGANLPTKRHVRNLPCSRHEVLSGHQRRVKDGRSLI